MAVLAGVLLAVGLLRLLVGGESLGWPQVPGALELRAQRLASGLAVGSALAVAGVLLQSLLRNPLASPDLMGLAAGAGLGVTLATYAAYSAGLGLALAPGAAQGPALVGAFAALGLVYALSLRSWLIDPVAMVLVGVAVSFVLGSASVLVQHLLPDRGESGRRWLMGALVDGTPSADVAILAGLTLAALGVGAPLSRAMDAAAMSEDEARSAGVWLAGLRAFQFIAAGLLTAGAVAIAGPLGFVGLVGPHVARLAAGPGHRGLLIASALAGAVLVVGADTALKSITIDGGRLPIGVLTSLIGGPVFIALLLRERSALHP